MCGAANAAPLVSPCAQHLPAELLDQRRRSLSFEQRVKLQRLIPQGARSKLEVLLLLLGEAPADAWVLWADNDAVFANRAFSFPFQKYEDAGKDLVIGGSEAEVLAGNGHRAP